MSRPPTRVWIALGSNVGDRRGHLESAVAALRAEPRVGVRRVSAWIETEPVGGPPGQGPYWNGVLEAETSLAPRALLALLQGIEARAGRDRDREVRDGPRTLDLDLLLFGEQEIDEVDLVVPHPRLEQRLFVLEPLSQLAPQRRLPGSGRTVVERVAELREVVR